MKTTIRKALGLSTLIFVAAGSGAAGAQYYGGLNFNLPRYGTVASVDRDEDGGFFIASTALDDRRVRYGLRLGYQVAPYLAVVSRYSDFDRRGTSSPLVRSYGIDLDSRIPLSARFSISGSAGVGKVRTETSFGGGFYPDLLASSGARAYTAGRLGLGMQYQVNNSLGIRFDVEKYRPLHGSSMGELDADHVSFGVTLRF
jgi:OOP family OmpA-OmpF porin